MCVFGKEGALLVEMHCIMWPRGFSNLRSPAVFCSQVVGVTACGFHTSMLVAKSRLIADPSVGVSDLMEPLTKLIKEKNEKNIFKLISPPANVSWKSATPVAWMASLAPLFKEYIKIAPNSIISGKKHKLGVTRLEEGQKVNFTRKATVDFVDWVDDTVRMGLSHFRTLKQQPDAKERAFKRADNSQKTMLDSVLDIMCVKMGPTEEQVATITEPASDHESSAALEPYALVPTEAKGPLNPEDIFDSVLSKYGNENEKTASALNDLKPTASPTPENCGPLKPSLSDVDLKILEEAQFASPICKEGKSQQQRLNMVKKSINPTGKKQGQGSKKGKGKGQGKGKDKKKGKDSNSGKNTKPAAKATSSGAKAKDAKHAKSAGVKRQPPASSSKEQDQFVLRVPEVVPDPAKCDVSRQVARNRFVSKAYYDTKNSMRAQGCEDAETLGSAARAAHAKAGKIFNQAWPLLKKAKADAVEPPDVD